MSLQLFYPQLLFVTKKETHIGDQSWGERWGEGEAKIKKKPYGNCFCVLSVWLLLASHSYTTAPPCPPDETSKPVGPI